MAKRNNIYKRFFGKYGIHVDSKYVEKIFKADLKFKLPPVREQILSSSKDFEDLEDKYLEVLYPYINEEAYIFYTMKSFIDNGTVMENKVVADNCREYLRNSNFAHYEIGKTEDGKNLEIKRITAHSLIGEPENIKETKLHERLDRIFNHITPISFFSMCSNLEMSMHFCKNHDLADYISRLGLIKMIEKVRTISLQQKLNFITGKDVKEFENEAEKALEKFKGASPEEKSVYYNSIPEYLRRYPAEFDIDKILMIAAFRATNLLENVSMTKIENMKYAELLKVCINEIRNRSTRVEGLAGLFRK